MGPDLLAGARWECTATPAGAIEHPDGLEGSASPWWPATVPGTAAGALAAAGLDPVRRDYDGEDWWFRCRFDGHADDLACLLTLEGLASIADVYLNGEPVGHSENMFRTLRAEVAPLGVGNELVIRCAALGPLLATRRSRPRWKTVMVTDQSIRWLRTSLLGRIPGWTPVPLPVGPWRPVSVVPRDGHQLLSRRLVAACDGDDGIIEVTLVFSGRYDPPSAALVRVGEASAPLSVATDGDRRIATAHLVVPGVERWWPHTHGEQPRYEVTAEIDGVALALGSVGFRSVEVDRSGGGFGVVVNGEPIFCRGAAWMPPDPVTLAASDDELRRLVALARAANMNMLRVPGTTTYADRRFFDLCDELGILVWQDCMFAFTDPPEEAAWVAEATAEVDEALTEACSHPSLALVCGNQEVEEIAAMQGLSAERRRTPFFDEVVPALLERIAPGTPYVSSNPTGGTLPFRMDEGVSQYFGVGGYLRSLDDPRRSGVRFAAECLLLATPPEPATVEQACGGPLGFAHDPGWKATVHRDAGRSWDTEDVGSFYARELFGIDPLLVRYTDPERMLELRRATNAELVSRVFSEWRRPRSSCDGGLIVALDDFVAGPGWGLIDALGVPKSTWYAFRRVAKPVALLVTDEGLNGLALHLVNDTTTEVGGTVTVQLYAGGERLVEQGEQSVKIAARGSVVLDAEKLVEGFRDITYAYRFGPPAYDVVAASLLDADGELVSQAVHLVAGQGRARESDIGLQASLSAGPDGRTWTVEVSTRRLAQWVSIEVPGYVAGDSWFHLPPVSTRIVPLRSSGTEEPPVGTVRAVNWEGSIRLRP